VNRKQKIALWVGLVNLAVMLLFPPFDSFSYTDTKSLVFAGFQFVFSAESNEVLNRDVLFLEIVVLLVNVGIAWLLLRDTRHMLVTERHLNYQNAILLRLGPGVRFLPWRGFCFRWALGLRGRRLLWCSFRAMRTCCSHSIDFHFVLHWLWRLSAATTAAPRRPPALAGRRGKPS